MIERLRPQSRENGVAKKKICQLCCESGIVLDVAHGVMTGKVCECVPALQRDVAQPKSKAKSKPKAIKESESDAVVAQFGAVSYSSIPESVLMKIEVWAATLKLGSGREIKRFVSNYRTDKCIEYHNKLVECLGFVLLSDEEKDLIELSKASAGALEKPKVTSQPASLFDFKDVDDAEISEISTPNPRIKLLKEAIRRIVSSGLPAIDSIKLAPKLNLPSEAESWLLAGAKESLLFWGPCGTGKTTYALAVAVRLILLGKGVFYLDVARLVSLFDLTKKLRFGSDLDVVIAEMESIKLAIRYSQIVLMDDIGVTANEAAYQLLAGICDGKTIIGTTNCWKDAEMSLQGKTLEMQTGPRFASRLLAAKCCYVGGEDRRQSLSKYTEIFPKEQVDSFHLPSISDGETTAMRWLQRNPAFQVLSTQERNSLIDENGDDIDAPARRRHDIWHHGDKLTIWGPILDLGDQVLFLALVKLLHDFHNEGGSGLTLVTTYRKIILTLGLATGSHPYKMLRHQLRRLTRTTVEFVGHNKRHFIGSFISHMSGEGDTEETKCVVALNPYLIRFYEADEYTRMRLADLKKMSDYELVLHQFAASHEGSVILPLQKFIDLSGKGEVSADSRRELKKKANAGIARLKSKQLLAPESHIDGTNRIHMNRLVTGTPAVASARATKLVSKTKGKSS